MKKMFLLTIAVFAVLFTLSTQAADENALQNKLAKKYKTKSGTSRTVDFFVMVGRACALYLPNRIMDATDIFTLGVGFGGKFGANVTVTEYFQLGGYHGESYFMAKDFNRQYGFGFANETKFDLFCFSYNKTDVSETTGTVREYVIESDGFSIPNFHLDAYRDWDVDFWRVGAEAGWLFTFKGAVHMVEVADLVAGLFFIDVIAKDDWK